MFKITRAARQILNSAKYIKDLVASSTNTITKYLKLSENQGYIEDVSNEFLFEKKLSEFANLKVQNSLSDLDVVIHKEGAIDWAAVRKLIYARFADEIAAKLSDAEENQNLETKSYAAREHAEDCSTYSITEEFKMFKVQGYDFAATREVLQNRNQDTNQSPKSIFERMKELYISGYISRYAGDDGLRQDIEDVMHKKAYVMQELRLRVSELSAFEFKCDQLQKVDILGEH